MESRRGQQSGSEQKDEAFIDLLSSQRRLLSEIGSGAQSGAPAPSQRYSRSAYGTRLSGELVHNRMNQPISNATSNEISYFKSSATGSDRLVDAGSDPGFTFASFETKASELMVDSDTKIAAKRTPSLGLGHSLSFLDSDHSIRGSLSPDRRDTPVEETTSIGKEKDCDCEEDEGEGDDLSSIEPLDYNYDLQPTLLINELISLDQSMARTQQSQLAIHNWDKQMGLKRSHSKTMRLSSRSRKKIRAFLKREITSISQQQPPPDGGVGI